MRVFKIMIAVFCITALILPVFAQSEDLKGEVSGQIKKTAPILTKAVPQPGIGSVGGEWLMLGLARSNSTLPETYISGYYNRVVSGLKEAKGVLTAVKYTEYARLILSLTALGYDVRDVGGYNLLEKLADFDTLVKQGVNGPIFALIALDSRAYEIPTVKGLKNQTTRQKLIDYILARECTDAVGVKGGFSIGTGEAQTDITAMALQALCKYKEQKKVAAAIERGLKVLERLEKNPASSAWSENSAESAAQIIVAKAALNIDASENVKALLKHAVKTGGFSHDGKGEFDLMASEQAFYALVAYSRYLDGKTPLYEMSDVSITKKSAAAKALKI